jgi:hypothetical protein
MFLRLRASNEPVDTTLVADARTLAEQVKDPVAGRAYSTSPMGSRRWSAAIWIMHMNASKAP